MECEVSEGVWVGGFDGECSEGGEGTGGED